MLALILLLCALIFGVLATVGVPSHPYFSWSPAAFTFWILYVLCGVAYHV
jgi:hypothetical protein